MTDRQEAPESQPGPIVHGACGKSWSGLRRAHCPACHETFNSDSAAEMHRRRLPAGGGFCLEPSKAGLVRVAQSWGWCWQKPGSDERFGLRSAA